MARYPGQVRFRGAALKTTVRCDSMTATLSRLRMGEVVNFEGINLRKVDAPIRPGDLYIAERNTGPKLLTCCVNNQEESWISSTTWDYPYDTWECVRVEEILP